MLLGIYLLNKGQYNYFHHYYYYSEVNISKIFYLYCENRLDISINYYNDQVAPVLSPGKPWERYFKSRGKIKNKRGKMDTISFMIIMSHNTLLKRWSWFSSDIIKYPVDGLVK